MEFTSLFAPSVTLAAYPGGHRSWHSDKPSAHSLTNYWFSPHSKADNNKLLNALHPSLSPSGEIPVCNTGGEGALPSLRPWQVDGALHFIYFVLLPSAKDWWLGEILRRVWLSSPCSDTARHTYKCSSAHMENWLNLERGRCPTENGVKSLFSPVLHY